MSNTVSVPELAGWLDAFEQGRLSEDEQQQLFQHLIDTGLAWRLSGHLGREAMRLIKLGWCALGEQPHLDGYGQVVPSREWIADGTPGSLGHLTRPLASPLVGEPR